MARGMGFHVIRGRPIASTDQFVRLLSEEYQRAFVNIGQRQMRMRGPITQTWKEETPTFGTNMAINPPRYEFRIILAGGWHKGNKKWLWLNDGTDVRYAKMTEDFSPKTRARNLRSGPGIGGLDYVDPRKPRPGIEPREWDEEIDKQTRQAVGREIAQALDNALRKALGGGS